MQVVVSLLPKIFTVSVFKYFILIKEKGVTV